MASRIFKPSRILAVVLVAGAAAWILSGRFGGSEAPAQTTTATPPAAPIPVQKVGVTTATPAEHRRDITLSCITQSDKRSMAVARGAGIVTELRVRRGSIVHAGDVLAILSDEGREAAVKQAEAMLEQRQAEYDANKRLIERGDSPRNNLPALEAAVAAAEAAVATAKAEAEKSTIKAPVDGMVDSVPVEVGQGIQPGAQIAEVVGADPMLAVGNVSERQRGLVQLGQVATVRFIDSTLVTGEVGFVSLSAEKATRTYRVEARLPNGDAKIADGVTCEMVIALKPVEATPIPRSALVFSDQGALGVRVADEQNKALFMPVGVIEDGRDVVWVSGIDKPIRVIVVGQDFVKDGDPVEAVSAAEAEPKKTEPPA